MKDKYFNNISFINISLRTILNMKFNADDDAGGDGDE